MSTKNNQSNQKTGRGGYRPGSGRKPGKVSAAKKAISEEAKQHAEAALKALVDIAVNGTNEGARVSAANALLDRGYGRPTQSLDHTSSDGTMTPKASIDASKLSDAALSEILNAKSDNG